MNRATVGNVLWVLWMFFVLVLLAWGCAALVAVIRGG